jgi:ADP-heptose:LPS heptosyltransferase
LAYIKNTLKITAKFRQLNTSYDMAVVLRSGTDNGILPLFLSGITKNITGFKTGGFGFCLDHIAQWTEFAYETENYCNVFKIAGISVHPTIPNLVSESVNHPVADKYIVLHMGSKETFKLLGTDKVSTILNTIINNTSTPVILTGLSEELVLYKEEDLQNNRIVNLIGKQSFQEFRETLLHASGVVTVDTAAAHIAATQVPTLVFFSGIVSHLEFQPLGERVTLARNPVQCAPCYKPCAERECMDFDVEQVVTKWLEETNLNITRPTDAVDLLSC